MMFSLKSHKKIIKNRKKLCLLSFFTPVKMMPKAYLACFLFLIIPFFVRSSNKESSTAFSSETKGRVLAVHLPGAPSHLNLMLTVSKSLLERGHHVLLLLEQNDYRSSKTILQRAGVPFLAYDTGYTERQWREGARSLRFGASTATMATGFQVWGAQTDIILKNVSLIASIREYSPTLVLGDFAFLASTALSQLFAVPQVGLSCAPLADPPHSTLLGFPNPLSSIPQFGSNLTLPMSTSDKFWNLLTWAKTNAFFKVIVGKKIMEPVLLSHGLSLVVPQAVIVNTDFSLEWPRSLPHNIKYVGPLLASPVAAEKAALAAPFGGRPFILASLGTFASLSRDEFMTVAKGFSMLSPVKVLWKVSTSDLPDGFYVDYLKAKTSGNVQIVETIAQNEILAGEGCLGFFTHAGVNSINEAAFHGIPIVALPLLGDQLDNVNKAISKGFAERVRLPLSSQNVFDALQKIIVDPVYKTNAQKLSFSLQNKYLSPLEEATSAIESVMKIRK